MTKDIDTGLLRQRRNLMAISAAFIVLDLCTSGILEGTRTFIGAVTITKPENLMLLLLVCYAYFLWRYWLYHSHILKPCLIKKPGNYKAKDIDLKLKVPSVRYDLYRFMALSKFYRRYWIKFAPNGAWHDYARQKNRAPLLYRNGRKFFLHWTCRIDMVESNESALISYMPAPELLTIEHHQVPFLKALSIYAICLFGAIKNHRSFSDYILPYCISAFALLISLDTIYNELSPLFHG